MAVTYLTAIKGFRDADEIPSLVLGHPGIDGGGREFRRNRDRKRLISLELSQARWSRWNEIVANATGEEVCARLGAALSQAGVGRPLAERMNSDGTAYEYDVFDDDSRYKSYQVEPLGDLDQALSPIGLADMRLWLRAE